MRCSFFFYHTDLGHNLFFFALFKPIILQVFTIWQDKYCTHSISRTIEARAGFAQQIIALTTLQNVCERMPGLFRQKKSFQLEIDMQGNNYELLVKTIKKCPKSPFRPVGRLLTFDKHQICSAINRVTIYASTRQRICYVQVLFPFIYKTVYGFVMCNL